MCGLFGLLYANQQPINVSMVEQATNILRHRGPDDEGYLMVNSYQKRAIPCAGKDTDPGLALPEITSFNQQVFDCAFGFRRLSIIDLSPSGHQPMSSIDGRYWIVYNGEIYNYLELRQELQSLGYTFHSNTDTEVLLVGYQEWGSEILPKLVGMFAFAILDIRSRKLFLARDYFGIKPLYYSVNQKRFAFASEIKALMSLPDIDHQVDPAAVYYYLRYGVTDYAPITLFAAVQNLPPAHYMEVFMDTPWQCQPKRYWQIELRQPLDLSFKDASIQMRDIFLRNVHLHLRSDVPVGATLSGGVDSTSITAAMRRELGQQAEIHSFSYIADDPVIDEEHWVDTASTVAKTISHKVRINPQEMLADLESLVYIEDEPVASSSMYAEHRVYRLIKDAGIKVTLGGQGADEMLGGYRHFLADRLTSLVRQGKWMEASYFFRKAVRLPGMPPHFLTFLATDQLLPTSLRNLGRKLAREEAMPEWMTPDWLMDHGGIPANMFYRRLYQVEGKEVLRQQLFHATFGAGLPSQLRSEDRNSMASSVESRVPFLTHEFANFVFSLPENFIINQEGSSKAVFKTAVNDFVPSEILYRRDKVGFQTPEDGWHILISQTVEDALSCETAKRIPIFNLPTMRTEWQSVRNGRQRYNRRHWRWLNLILWAKCYNMTFE